MVTQTANALVQSKVRVAHPESKILGRIITTKLVGVSFEDRQEAIARLHTGDRVWLEPETNNPYDPYAVLVTRNNGEQIGYLNRHLAAHLSPYFEKYGRPVMGKVRLLTGSSFDGFALGLVICFKIPKLTQTHTNHRKHQFMEWED